MPTRHPCDLKTKDVRTFNYCLQVVIEDYHKNKVLDQYWWMLVMMCIMGLEVCDENIGAIMPISCFVLRIQPLALVILQYVAI